MTSPLSEETILIRGGHVTDGLGSPSAKQDILIEGGRIVALVAPSVSARRGVRVVDAEGLVVAPGFIDLHSHADYTVETESAASGQLAQGVTSIVTGNCGWSPFPVEDLRELREWSAFLGGEATYDWRDFAGFAARVNDVFPAVNVLPLVGHAPVRIAVLGGAKQEPSPDELLRMTQLVARSQEQGAWGFSTGLIYAPGSFSSSYEVSQLVRAATATGGLYSTHMRDETSHVRAALEEAIEAAEDARRAGTSPRLQISHLKAMGRANHGTVPALLDRIDEERASGLDIAADVYPYTASGTTLATRLPAWALDGGLDALCARLADAETRRQIAAALGARIARGDVNPDGIVLNSLTGGRFSAAQSSSLTSFASELGVPPEEAALTLLDAYRGTVGIINHAMVESDVQAAIAHPLVAIASDGGQLIPHKDGTTHPRSFGTFPRIFSRYVRELGVISLEEAVRKCTSLPASRLGLRDRGVIREGAIADLTLFDPITMTDRADFADPWQLSEGVHCVIVNGQIQREAGQDTGVRAGRVLKHVRPTSS